MLKKVRLSLEKRPRVLNRARSGNVKIIGFLTFLATLTAIVFGVLYGQTLLDGVAAAQFKAPRSIEAIQSELQLTNTGKTIFYASQPLIADQSSFNQSCQSTERTAAMLGCYYQRKIYLFNITNPELNGAVEVTAAHEMLHAAYDRLLFFDRDRVNDLVEAEYEKHKTDKRIQKLMDYYEKAEPGSLLNELHSIIGTTVESIDPELEKHYARYFFNRQAIVAMNESYNAVFDAVQNEADELSAKIKSEETEITAALRAYESKRKLIEIDIETFNQRASSGGFSSQSSFMVARNSLTSRVAAINAEREAVNQRVDAYNILVSRLKELSVRSSELNKSINGIEAPETIL